jgi:hypothetical protein
MSTIKVNTIKDTSGTEVYTAKAWVNFNGTGTVAIRAAGNVSSITDNGTGDYTVNFTNAMPDADFSSACYAHHVAASGWYRAVFGPQNTIGQTASTFRLHTVNVSYVLNDTDYVQASFFR